MKLKNINKILFITLSNIGDVILTLSVLSALKDNFPDGEIDVVVGSRPKEIFVKDPAVRKIFTYDKHARLKEKIDFIKTLRRERYDLVVDMRTSLIPVLIGAKNRSSLVSINRCALRHKKAVHLNKLKHIGIECRRTQNIYIDNKDRERVQLLLEERGLRKDDILIGISPACRSLLKQWRTEGFVEVIDSLLREGRYKIVLIGEPTQTAIARDIKDAIRHKDLIDLTGRTNLNELFAVTERMRVLLTCDSASMHIACDIGVKVVAIFGPTDVEEYGPTGKDDIVIQRSLQCSPCKRAVCRFDRECMEGIDAQEVLGALKKLINLG
jgi:heptosyltransferase-2